MQLNKIKAFYGYYVYLLKQCMGIRYKCINWRLSFGMTKVIGHFSSDLFVVEKIVDCSDLVGNAVVFSQEDRVHRGQRRVLRGPDLACSVLVRSTVQAHPW